MRRDTMVWLGWALASLSFFGIYEWYVIIDGDPNTSTLTTNIANFIPSEIFFAVFGGFAIWFGYHMIKWYRKFGKE